MPKGRVSDIKEELFVGMCTSPLWGMQMEEERVEELLSDAPLGPHSWRHLLGADEFKTE